MSWWIGAAVSGLAALGCGLGNRRQNQRLSRLNQARATTVEELFDLQATVAAQMGAGSFQEAVKLSGAIACESPLTAPWSGQSCVAYIDTTTRLVEEEKTTVTTDSEGVQHETTSWERRDEVISREARRTDFALVQGEYQIPVRTEGADLEMEKVFSTTDRRNSLHGIRGREIGLQREETVLQAKGEVFIVARCSDASGQLQLEANPGDGLFVVRRGSEDTYSRSLQRWTRIWLVASLGLSGLTAAFVVAALTSG